MLLMSVLSLTLLTLVLSVPCHSPSDTVPSFHVSRHPVIDFLRSFIAELLKVSLGTPHHVIPLQTFPSPFDIEHCCY